MSPVVTVFAVTVSTLRSLANATFTAPLSTDVVMFVPSPFTVTVSPRGFLTEAPSSAVKPKPLVLISSTAVCN